jgi:hypothetical protein
MGGAGPAPGPALTADVSVPDIVQVVGGVVAGVVDAVGAPGAGAGVPGGGVPGVAVGVGGAGMADDAGAVAVAAALAIWMVKSDLATEYVR